MARILYLSVFLYPFAGGASKSMIPLLSALRRNGHEIVTVNGGPHVTHGREASTNRDGYLALMTDRPIERARQLFESFRPDVVFTQSWGSVEAIELAERHAVDTICFVIDLFLLMPEAAPARLRTDYEHNRAVHRRASVVVSNSLFTQRKVRELLGVESELVYPVIDRDEHLVVGPRDPIYLKYTFHLVPVGGRWTWLLSTARYHLYRDDGCAPAA